MPRIYSKRALAELIAQGYDTASAADLFGRKLRFIEKEQETTEYQRILEALLNRKERPRIIKEVSDTAEPQRTYSSTF